MKTRIINATAISKPKNKLMIPAGFDTDSINRSLKFINALTAT
ncbi:hypothetical protein ED5_3150 [Enterobacter roggenkampii]|nr:hypothetical protein ED5_3150 [Enterobacter roggenkampii]